jgi:TRAP-type C4-dicarboxylate transport system substrate-binding protein
MVRALNRSRTRAGVLALGIASSLVLAGCADTTESTGGGSQGSGEGVPFGATMEEYQEAFADVDPIELQAQSTAPKGSTTGAPFEQWAEAVTEWSDGKITFDWAYSNAVAPVMEVDNALNDGRLDVGVPLPIYEPDEFPAMAALLDTLVLSDQSPILGAIHSDVWPIDVALNNESVMSEQEEHGLVQLVPVFAAGAQTMWCSEPKTSLDDFKGVPISASGTAQTAQVAALGASPTQVSFTEEFTSLQRGVIECSNSNSTTGALGGYISEVPHLTTSPEFGFAPGTGSWAVSKLTWDELPLVAQQLMWDKVDVFLASNVEDKVFPNHAEAAKVIRENDGSVNEFDTDAAEALRAASEEILNQVRQTDAVSDPDALVDAAIDSSDTWRTKLEDAGFTAEVGYEEFDQEYDPAEYDITKYTDLAMEDIYSAHRPE